MGDADLEAPLNPPSSKHTSVSLSNPVCYMRPSTVSSRREDERAERWHDGVAGGVVSLYSVTTLC